MNRKEADRWSGTHRDGETHSTRSQTQALDPQLETQQSRHAELTSFFCHGENNGRDKLIPAAVPAVLSQPRLNPLTQSFNVVFIYVPGALTLFFVMVTLYCAISKSYFVWTVYLSPSMHHSFPLHLASEWPGSVCRAQVANKLLTSNKQRKSAVKTAVTSLQQDVTKYLHSSTRLLSAITHSKPQKHNSTACFIQPYPTCASRAFSRFRF